MAEGLVHVIDDDEAMRDSLSFLLDSAGLESRLYASAQAFLTALPEVTGGCVLTDVRMPEMSGLDLVRHLKAAGSALPVVVMTGHADVPLAIEAMKLGIVDFIEKPFDDEALLGALADALVHGAAHSRREGERAAVATRLASLSSREADVLKGLVAGQPNKVIAFDLGISPRTVEIYRANLMTKMQASSLSDLVRMSLQAGGDIAPQ